MPQTCCIFIIIDIYYCFYTCVLYSLALMEPSNAWLPSTCHPKAVGGVCHATNYQLPSQQFVNPTNYMVC